MRISLKVLTESVVWAVIKSNKLRCALGTGLKIDTGLERIKIKENTYERKEKQ